MAQRKQIASNRKKELTAQLAESRQAISHSKVALKQHFTVKKQLRRFVSNKPKTLFAGSVLAGLMITLFLKRPRKAKESAPKTTSQILLSWGLTLLKPVAKAWLIARAKNMATARLSQFQSHAQDTLEPDHL